MRPLLLSLLLILLASVCRAQGGPPMITDDPDTPGDKSWEINLADIAGVTRFQKTDLVPYVDANYGWGERLQLKLQGGYGIDNTYGQRAQSGPGALLAGFKWRFWDQAKDGALSVSMYPQFSFHPSFGSKDASIAPPGNYWLLPLQLSKRWGPFALNPDAGYNYETRSGDSFWYGLLGAWEPRDRLEFLAEVHGDAAVQTSGTDLVVNFGARVPLGGKILAIASVGHTVKTLNGEQSQLLSYLPGAAPQWLSYLGVQLKL